MSERAEDQVNITSERWGEPSLRKMQRAGGGHPAGRTRQVGRTTDYTLVAEDHVGAEPPLDVSMESGGIRWQESPGRGLAGLAEGVTAAVPGEAATLQPLAAGSFNSSWRSPSIGAATIAGRWQSKAYGERNSSGRESRRSDAVYAPAARKLREVPPGEGKTGQHLTWFGPEGLYIGSKDGSGTLDRWDLCTCKKTVAAVIPHEAKNITCTAFAPDGNCFAIGSDIGLRMHTFPLPRNGQAGSPPLWEVCPKQTVHEFAFSRDSELLACTLDSIHCIGLLKIYEVKTGKSVPVDNDQSGRFAGGSVCWSDTCLAVAGRQRKTSECSVQLLRKSDLSVWETLELSDKFLSMDFNPAGTRLAVGMLETPVGSPCVKIFRSDRQSNAVDDTSDKWARDSPLAITNQTGNGASAQSLAYSNNGQLLATGFSDCNFAVWDVQNDVNVLLRVYSVPLSFGNVIAWSPADDLLACGGGTAPVVMHEMLALDPKVKSFRLKSKKLQKNRQERKASLAALPLTQLTMSYDEANVSGPVAKDNSAMIDVFGDKQLLKTTLKKGDGSGVRPVEGDNVCLVFRGHLEDGSKFDSSSSRGHKHGYEFKIGADSEIRGLSEAAKTMEAGEEAVFALAPQMAYGERTSRSRNVPPDATLHYTIKLHSFSEYERIEYAVSNDTLVALTNGRRLIVRERESNVERCDVELPDHVCSWSNPLALRPDGSQVSCAMMGKNSVSVRCTHTGDEVYSVTALGDDLTGCRYTPDGAWLAVWTGSKGARICDAENLSTGNAPYGSAPRFVGGKRAGSALAVRLTERGAQTVHDVVFDEKCRYIAITGDPKLSRVYSMENGAELASLDPKSQSVGATFSPTGSKFAYVVGNFEYCGEVVVLSTDNWTELYRVSTPQRFREAPYCISFSPDKASKYLLIADQSVEETEAATQIAVLDSCTGKEMPWSCTLGPLLLPDAAAAGTIRWIKPSPSEADLLPDSTQLLLQAAVGTDLLHLDLPLYMRSFEEDGNFSVEQLSSLSCTAGAIEAYLARWPQAINSRCPQTGNTVLHQFFSAPELARRESVKERKPVENWLAGRKKYTLLKNHEGLTALHYAANKKSPGTVKVLCRSLSPQLRLSETQTLLADLLVIAENLPGRLAQIVRELEDPAGFGLFRTEVTVETLQQPLDDFAVRALDDEFKHGATIQSGILHREPWSGYRTDWDSSVHSMEAVPCTADLQVLALNGFSGRASSDDGKTPFAKFFEAAKSVSDAQLSELMQTKLMVVTTQYKWDAWCHSCTIKRIIFFSVHCVFAAITLFLSTRPGEHWMKPEDHVGGFLHVVMLIFNSIVLWNEYWQFALEKAWTDYLWGWNVIDAAGIIALYVASTAHFSGHQHLVQTAGAYGVLLNSVSFLQLYRPIKGLGQFVEILVGIIEDFPEFGKVAVIIFVGFTLAFAISMPDNESFDDRGVLGLSSGIMTVFRASMGSFHVEDYTTTQATALFVLFMFVTVIIMLVRTICCFIARPLLHYLGICFERARIHAVVDILLVTIVWLRSGLDVELAHCPDG